MAHGKTPHFVNDVGVERVRINAKEFMCMGAAPPFDHPHEFLDMGDETEIVCPYCSTLYVFDASLPFGASDPAECAYTEDAA